MNSNAPCADVLKSIDVGEKGSTKLFPTFYCNIFIFPPAWALKQKINLDGEKWKGRQQLAGGVSVQFITLWTDIITYEAKNTLGIFKIFNRIQLKEIYMNLWVQIVLFHNTMKVYW